MGDEARARQAVRGVRKWLYSLQQHLIDSPGSVEEQQEFLESARRTGPSLQEPTVRACLGQTRDGQRLLGALEDDLKVIAAASVPLGETEMEAVCQGQCRCLELLEDMRVRPLQETGHS